MLNFDASWTRRRLFKGGLLGLMTTPWAIKSNIAKAAVTKRVAIVGGGMGGVSAAYFLGPDWAIDMYEAEDHLGGHGDTRIVSIDGEDHPVDMGADFFHPKSHPIYWSFLEHVGIRTPDNKSQDLTIETAATLNIFDRNSGDSQFNSVNIISHPFRAVNFLVFTEAARIWATTNTPLQTTVGEWIGALPVPSDFKDNYLSPWVSAISSGQVEQVNRVSARAHLATVAASFPANPFQKVISYNAKIGIGGFINLVASRVENLKAMVSTPVSQLEEVNGQWFVTSSKGREGPYDAVILNAPPPVAKRFFDRVEWAKPIADLLASQEYYNAEIAVHADPVFMPKDQKTWAVQNVAIDRASGQPSIDVGKIFEPVLGKKISLFKSWVGKRPGIAKKVFFTKTYQHPLQTNDYLNAAKALNEWQGVKNLYFSGHYVTFTDLQETALYSGLRTAQRLSPDSPTLKAFTDKLAAENLDGITYEVP